MKRILRFMSATLLVTFLVLAAESSLPFYNTQLAQDRCAACRDCEKRSEENVEKCKKGCPDYGVNEAKTCALKCHEIYSAEKECKKECAGCAKRVEP